MEVIFISEYPINHETAQVYRRKLGNTEIIVENIHPKFENEEDRLRARDSIRQILFEIFSKYVEDC